MRVLTKLLLIITFLLGILDISWSEDRPTFVAIHGRQVLVNGEPFIIEGVRYSPVPIGIDPETMPPYGDYFTSEYHDIVSVF